MAEIVNLRQARKRAQRRKAEAAAADNRVTFGLSRAHKAKAGSEREKILQALDGARLERAAGPDQAE